MGKSKLKPPATKGNKKRDKLGDKGDKTLGRRAHHPTQNTHVGGGNQRQLETKGENGTWEAHMWGDNGRQ